MAKILVHAPDGTAPRTFALEDGDALLVGREPSEDAANVSAQRRRLATIPSPLVSGNHLLVWREAGELHARDLESKNGSYLRLGRGGDLRVSGVEEAHFFVAALRPPALPGLPEPVPVAAAADEFAAGVRDSVSAWLHRAGMAPRLRVVPAAELEPAGEIDGPFQVPLVDGLRLEVGEESSSATLAQWDSLKRDLFQYAYEQAAIFRTVRAAALGRSLAYVSPISQRALREVLDAASAGLPLVLNGESGTGKTQLAAIYAGRDSNRGKSQAPFITVHCAHLNPPLAHSLLFGAMRGSYTSADRNIVGAVQMADGGTLFLDDVDALSLDSQAKLLRFLDSGEYEPLGHGQARPQKAHVRVVAGSNVDLRAAVRERRFREDLYWRLHVGAVVCVPPLRERPEDLDEVLRRAPGFAADQSRSVRSRLDGPALELLHQHRWRGNFRECLRFCARVRREPEAEPGLDARRCQQLLAEVSLDREPAPAVAGEPGSAFASALEQSLAAWSSAEGKPPERFEDLQRFCEMYLKSFFVAHVLGLAEASERPASFDREARQRLGCDLSTLKRKLDDYLALRAQG